MKGPAAPRVRIIAFWIQPDRLVERREGVGVAIQEVQGPAAPRMHVGAFWIQPHGLVERREGVGAAIQEVQGPAAPRMHVGAFWIQPHGLVERRECVGVAAFSECLDASANGAVRCGMCISYTAHMRSPNALVLCHAPVCRAHSTALFVQAFQPLRGWRTRSRPRHLCGGPVSEGLAGVCDATGR